MKLIKKLSVVLASVILITATAIPCFAEEDIYYAQNGLVDMADGTGLQMYGVSNSSGYDQMVTVYVLCEKKCYDYKTSIYFDGIADCDPDKDSKEEYSSFDYFSTPFYPVNMRYEEDWNDGEASIYSFDISLAAGRYSFIQGGTNGYYAMFDPISPTFEDYHEETSWKNYNDPDNKKYFLSVSKGSTARVYGIFYMRNDKTGGHSTFYDDNIEEFIKWSIKKERSLLAFEDETDTILGKTEEISVSVSEEDILDALEEKLSTIEKPQVEIVEGPEESTAEVAVVSEKKEFPMGLAIGGGILVVVIIVILVVTKRRR